MSKLAQIIVTNVFDHLFSQKKFHPLIETIFAVLSYIKISLQVIFLNLLLCFLKKWEIKLELKLFSLKISPKFSDVSLMDYCAHYLLN